MSLAIRPATPSEITALAGTELGFPALGHVGLEDGQIIGGGGLAWGGGRCWLWLTMARTEPRYAVPILRQVRRTMAKAVQLGEREIFTPRDEVQTSLRLLGHLGFVLHGIENGIEVWRWQR